MITFQEAKQITNGKLLQLTADYGVRHLFIDSRKPVLLEGGVFIAIAGIHHDGHDFITDLYNKGLRQFIIERPIDLQTVPEANVLLVDSSIAALQSIAAHHRSQFKLNVIGITGSNAKTILKEWLYQVLSPDYSIVKNPGSYNSQIGVPLSVWQIQSYHQLGIFEAGISIPGEMNKLEAIIQPSLGIFSNIGPSHDEGFVDLQQKIEEKLKLFTQVKTLIYCADHHEVHRAISTTSIPTLSWGVSTDADIQIESSGTNNYPITFRGLTFNIQLPFKDRASIENTFHIVAALLMLGYHPDVIQQRINVLKSIPMRLKLREGINNCYVIDDSYNNDLSGLRISLDFLSGQHQKEKRRLILSDILQSGMDETQLVQRIAELVNKSGVHACIGIGHQLQNHQELFTIPSKFYGDTDSFLKTMNRDDFHDEMILLKGARRFQFEKILAVLQRKVHGTVMEINLDAMVANLNYFRARLLPSTKIMVMVKAFAYGSGSAEVANLLQYHKVDYLGVAYADEGIELRKNNIHLPIMVMNPSEESFSVLLHHQLEPEIYSFRILKNYIDFLKGSPSKIHIKLDTGMHRLGFNEYDMNDLVTLLRATPNITVVSVFSHLSGADDSEHDSFSELQAEKFQQCANKIAKGIGYKPLFHLLNSPGILRLSKWQMDMVRLGIGLYGVDPTTESSHPLQPVATLKTVISQIRKISEGETIGYGRKGKANGPTVVATLAIGYADGYSRSFSNGVGKVLIHGQLAPVIGNVCMDMIMVDITGILAEEGDEAIVFGDNLPIGDVARWANTIPYEILTNTSERVKRVFVAESL